MTREQIFDKVKELAVDRLSADPAAITGSASLTDDLGADSLDIVEFVMALEEEFKIEIADSDAESIKTVDNAIDFIMKKIA